MAESNCPSARFPIPDATCVEPHETRLIIRRSKFVTRSAHCADLNLAKEFIAKIKAQNADASHNCWAFVAGPPGDTAHMGSSDDGEPHGSAGRPMLNILLHCGIGQICVVVSRWFGGVKLGIGGLTRAYQDSTLENISSLKLTEAVSRSKWAMTIEYAHLPQIRRLLDEKGAAVIQENYGEQVDLVIEAPDDRSTDLHKLICDASNGKCIILPWQNANCQ